MVSSLDPQEVKNKKPPCIERTLTDRLDGLEEAIAKLSVRSNSTPMQITLL